MGKEPSFQYYPKDWRADAVFGCCLAARGLWHEMMNMMHASERYGYLGSNGLPIPDEQIARYCGCTLQEYQTLLAELERAGVPRRTSNGILFSKRMVEDAKQRVNWRKQKKNQRLKASQIECPADVRSMSAPSPIPSPSPPSKKEEKKNPSPPKRLVGSNEFAVFWDAYPRKVDRQEALKAWVKGVCDGNLGEILAGLESWKRTEQWRDLEKVPYPSTWLNKRRWVEVPRTGSTITGGENLYERAKRLERAAGISR